jgi:quinol monooxygenase YgiN
MLIVVVDFTVSAANSALALATMQDEAPIVRALPGNLGYSFWADPHQPGAWRLMHEWSDIAGFEDYRASPGFKSAGAVLFPLMLETPSSRIFDAQARTA